MSRTVAVISLLFILLLVNWSIFTKEKQLAEGQIVYLALAPVDPRSLMQGDYMALRFQVADEVHAALPSIDAQDGHVVVTLDDHRIGRFARLHDGGQLDENELLLRYRVRAGSVRFATNAYFFQEGHGSVYEAARYGQFRVDGTGEMLLTALYDEQRHKLAADGLQQAADR